MKNVLLPVMTHAAVLISTVTAGAALASAGGASSAQTTYYVDGGSASCSDGGPGSQSRPWCDIPDAPPAGSEVVVYDKGSSYGYVNPRSANVTYRGAGAPDVSGLAGPVDRSLFAGRAMPEAGDLDIEADGVTWRGFRHVGARTAPMAALGVRQAVNARIEGNEIDFGGIRLRDADRAVVRANFLHNGPTQTAGRAETACPCALWIGTYNDGSGSNGSDDVRFELNRIDDWRGDIVNIQNRSSGSKLLHNKGVHIEREPGSDEHTDTFQLVGSGDVEIVGNDFRDVQHGILITDRTPQDRNGDGWAIRVASNIIEARNGRSFLGPPGPGSRVVNNTFVRAQTWDDDRDGDGEIDGNDWAGECDVDWTESRDPGAHSQGAVFANNFCKGASSLADARITQAANIWIPRFEEFEFLADYELPAGSPAVDAGHAAYAPELDLRGRARVGAPDVGALERGGTDPDPTPDPTPDPAPDPTPDPDPEPTPEVGVLRTSDSAGKSNPAPLQSAVVSGDEYVFLDGSGTAGPVRFHLDESPDGSPFQTENSAPWDFRGGTATAANPWDTRTVVNGTHRIVAVTPNGRVEATFTIANDAAEPDPDPDPDPDPTPPPGPGELRWSAEVDRSPHSDLEGATLTGPACVFLDNDPAKRGPVRFHVDEAPDSSPYRTESNAPWDLFGGSSSSCGLGSLAPGRHTVTAVWSGGQVSATFAVQ